MPGGLKTPGDIIAPLLLQLYALGQKRAVAIYRQAYFSPFVFVNKVPAVVGIKNFRIIKLFDYISLHQIARIGGRTFDHDSNCSTLVRPSSLSFGIFQITEHHPENAGF